MKNFKTIKTTLKIRFIAKKIINLAYQQSKDGNYHLSFLDAAAIGKVDVSYIDTYKRQFAEAFDSDTRVSSVTWEDDHFDIVLYWDEYSY